MPSKDSRIKQPNNPRNTQPKPAQKLSDGFSFREPRFVERYLDATLCIIVRLRIDGVEDDLCACFYRDTFPGGDCSPVLDHGVGIGFLRGDKNATVNANRGQESVFVDNVQSMEPPKGIIPSLVRFEFMNEVHRIVPYSLYLGIKEGSLVFLPTVGNGESGFLCRLSAIGDNQGIHQIIKGRSQVLKHVAGKKRNFRRNVRVLRRLKSNLDFLRIELYRDAIGIRINKLSQGGIEFIDTLVGPIELEDDLPPIFSPGIMRLSPVSVRPACQSR